MAQLYVVKRGDTLRRIARATLGDAALHSRIAEFNGLRDPNRLFVGQRLEIPARRDLAPPVSPLERLPPARPGAEVLEPPHGLAALLAQFGDLYAYLREDGTLDPRWEAEQLARAALPFPLALSWDPGRTVRSIRCHRRLAALFPALFAELERRGLRGKLRSFGGCFNFRAKRSSNKLSTHCWGIAIDLNPETNPIGRPGDMPGAVVEVFESFGFAWGGRWPGRAKDPMHFQFCSGY
jgi:murein DD-endopeptidase MepM/ murein hydrolase activator NlpD